MESVEIEKVVNLKTGRKIYEMTAKPRGVCIIINNKNFKERKLIRLGSEKDTELLKVVFEKLYFDVISYSDLKADDINIKLENLRKQKFEGANAFIAIFSSHGGDSYILGTDLERIYIKDIVEKFNNEKCSNLVDKPKIFIFMSCLGNKMDTGVFIKRDYLANEILMNSVLKPTYTDIMICTSTITGYISFRNPGKGTWLGHIMARTIARRAHYRDFEWILKSVARKIARRNFKVKDKNSKTTLNAKQSISWQSLGWQKLLYFNPSFSEETNR